MSTDAGTPRTLSRGVARWGYLSLGMVCVAVGSVGIVVPGLPTTVFFIIAAWAFARSSPRFERWILSLPRIGPMIQAHRAGLGMPRRAKVLAIATMAVFVLIGVYVLSSRPAVAAAVGLVGLVGAAYIAYRVPTREAVLASRSAVR